VFRVQVRSGTEADEELGAVCVGSCISHRQHTLVSVGIPDLLVFKLFTVDASSSCSILVCNVTALGHEALDDPVEDVVAVGEIVFILARANCSEVLGSLGNLLREEFHHNSFLLLFFSFIAHFNIEEYLSILRVKCW